MNSRMLALCTTAASAALALMLLPSPSRGQTTDADKAKAAKAAAKAKNIARTIEENAAPLTVFDRQGKVVQVFGDKALYSQPSLSPDGTRAVVIRTDLEKETADAWVLEVATGKSTRVTNAKSRESVRSPLWSPDGRQVAFCAIRDAYDGIYRVDANGEGHEELLYKATSAGLVTTDWSLDGKFINFYIDQLGDNTIYALPLDGKREPILLARSKDQIQAARLSPDGRFLGYRSNESGQYEVYVRAFDPDNPQAAAAKWKVSDNGGLGMVWWRRDGRELYYFAADRGIMAVEVSTSPQFEFGKPKLLFKAPTSIAVGPNSAPGNRGSASRDGQRFVFALPPEPRLQQLTVFDRSGKVVAKLGASGMLGQPAYSPDGKEVAYVENDLATGRLNIRTLDIATGKITEVTNDTFPKSAPTWTPDGKHIAYQSNRGSYTSIYWRPSDGSGQEEILFRYTPGAGMGLGDISPDGKYAIFDGGAIIMGAPITKGSDALARRAVEVSREEYEVGLGHVSPDGAFMAYLSTESNDRPELFVRSFDSKSGTMPETAKVQVTRNGANGGNLWRGDGRELYYMHSEPGSDQLEVMAVEISTSPQLKAGEPKQLFALKDAGGESTKFVSPDGQHFIFAVLQPRTTP